MNGYPGKLTQKNIDGARAAGRDYIVYKHRTYSLKELEDGAGISRVKPESNASKKLRERGTNNSDGEVTESGSNERKEQT